MKKVLIIGGTGNISTALTAILLERGYQLTLLNRGNTPVPQTTQVVCDRMDRAGFRAAIAQLPDFDCVIDMIAYEEADALQLTECFAGRCEQLILCSTVDTFAKPARVYPVTESEPRMQNPAFAYAHKKGQIESALERDAARGAFNLTIIRPAATYNDFSQPIGILSGGYAVMRRMIERKPILMHGDGTSLWTSTHRDDVALAMANAVNHPRVYGNSYNVCGTEALSWISYYDLLAEALHAPKPEYVHIPSEVLARIAPDACGWCPLNFMYSNIFDNTAAVRDLDFTYTVPWAQGAQIMARNRKDAADHPLYNILLNRWEQLTADLTSALTMSSK